MNIDVRKIKKVTIILVILIIILVIAIFFLRINQKAEEEKILDENQTILEKVTLEKVDSKTEYLTIKSCVESYYTKIDLLNAEFEGEEISQEQYEINNAKNLMSLLNTDYINDKQINNENDIINIYKNYKYNNLIIEDIYLTQLEDNVDVYLVFGMQINNETNEMEEDSGLVLVLDWKNNIYSVAPYEYMRDRELTNVENINREQIEKIESKIEKYEDGYNTFIPAEFHKNDWVVTVFNEFRLNVKFNPEKAYNILDKQYSTKRFGNEQNAYNYFKNEFNTIFGDKLEKMTINDSDPNYTQFICMDNKGNYFIFDSPDQECTYSVYLDIYTIPIEQLKNKYNESNNAEKTALNIQKFKYMINLKDYNSAYNVLDETFRENNFGSVEKFEEYVKQNWPEYINIKCSDYNEVGDVGTIDGVISEKDVTEEEQYSVIRKTFIVKLVDENNFVMSFNIE